LNIKFEFAVGADINRGDRRGWYSTATILSLNIISKAQLVKFTYE